MSVIVGAAEDGKSVDRREEGESVTQVASMAGNTSADNDAGGHGDTPAPSPYVLSNAEGPLDRDGLVAIDAWWHAMNYLAVGQTHLSANPFLPEPLQPKHINASRRSSWKRAVRDEEVAL